MGYVGGEVLVREVQRGVHGHHHEMVVVHVLVITTHTMIIMIIINELQKCSRGAASGRVVG